MKMEASLQMHQTLKLAPQVIQSIEILQLSTMSLIDHIQQELEENPVLEEMLTPVNEEQKSAQEGEEETVSQELPTDNTEEADKYNQLAEDWDDYFSSTSSRKRGLDGEIDQKQQAIENTAAKPMSLQEYLLEQLSLTTVPDDLEEVCEK